MCVLHVRTLKLKMLSKMVYWLHVDVGFEFVSVSQDQLSLYKPL